MLIKVLLVVLVVAITATFKELLTKFKHNSIRRKYR